MYQKHFGFTAWPFANAPDPKIFYSNPVYQDALSKLRYGVVLGKGPMVLTGAAGTGKTVLLKKLFDDLGAAVKPIWLADRDISFTGILRALLAEVDSAAKTTDLAPMIEALYHTLLQRRRAGVVSCLIVEDAERLESETIECLTELCRFQVERERLLQLILVGQPLLATKLEETNNPRLNQGMALHCRLFALTRSELDRYIKFHLQAAGYPGESLIPHDAIDRIAHYSGGVPRLVNALCDNALRAAYRSSKSAISQALVDKVAMEMGMGTDQAANTRVTLPIDAAPLPVVTQNPITYLDPDLERDATRTATAKRPRRRAAMICTTALLAFVMFVVANWARYSNKAFRFAEYFERQPQAANPDLLFLTANPDKEIVQQGVRLEASGADSRSAPLATHYATDTVLSGSQSSPMLKPPAPSTQQHQTQETSQNKPGRLLNAARQHLAKKPAGEKPRQILPRAPGLNLKVQQAIHNRAIKGVSARLVNGTVYLEGLVASEQQKSRAEIAARGVPGVVRLRNQVNVRPAN